MTTPSSTSSPGTGKPGIDEIEADIARTREELADTVDELAARLDVKTRAQDRVRQTKDQAAARVRELNDRAGPEGRLVGALTAAVLVFAALVTWRRRR